MPIKFPPLHTASPEGLLAIGGILNTQTLLSAYKQGIFPWPISSDSPLTWFSPDPRGIIRIQNFHISKSFSKFIKKANLVVRFNTDFKEVLRRCSQAPRQNETGTWITEEIITGYENLFHAGYSYCVSVYKDEKLIGGLYGVTIGRYISGESMFFSEPNASKLALYKLIQQLKKSNITWLDTQMVTPIIESFGGENIKRDSFIKMLNKEIHIKLTRDEIFA